MRKNIYTLLIIFFCIYHTQAQGGGDWENIMSTHRITSIIYKNGTLYAASDGGLVTINTATQAKKWYNPTNSPLKIGRNINLHYHEPTNQVYVYSNKYIYKYHENTNWDTLMANDYTYIGSMTSNQNDIWIGNNKTYLGNILKYDGTNIHGYRNDTFLNGNWFASDIAVDNQSNKWIGTSEGLVFLAHTDTTWVLPVNHPYQNGINSVEIHPTTQDIWGVVSTNNNPYEVSIFRYDRNNTWTIYNANNTPILSGKAGVKFIYNQKFHIDANGHLWTAIDNRLVKYDGLNWSDYPLSNYPNSIINCLYDDEQGNIWVGTNIGKIVRFDGNSFQEEYDARFTNYNGDYLYNISIDKNNHKWLGGVSSLTEINSDNTIWKDWSANIGYTRVRAIAIDSTRNHVWIGHEKKLSLYDGTTWTTYSAQNSSLPDTAITSLAVDTDGSVWIGTENGLVVKNGNNWTVYTFGFLAFPKNMVTCISIEPNGKKWIGTWFGVLRFQNGQWTRYGKNNSQLPDDGIFCIAIDKNNKKWIGTSRNYLATLDDTNNTWEIYHSSLLNNLPSFVYYMPDIIVDNQNVKWIIAGGAGLLRYDNQSFYDYRPSNSGMYASPDKVAIDKQNQKWVIGGGVISILKEWPISTQPIENEPNSPLKLYPNPFEEVLQVEIEGAAGRYELAIFDVWGRTVYMQTLEAHQKEEWTIHTPNLANGLYFVQLKNDKGEQFVKKIVRIAQ